MEQIRFSYLPTGAIFYFVASTENPLEKMIQGRARLIYPIHQGSDITFGIPAESLIWIERDKETTNVYIPNDR